MRDSGIDIGLVRKGFDDSRREFRGQGKGFFGFRKMFRDYLTKLNVAWYDECCPAATPEDIFPIRFNAETETIEYFNGTTWAAATISDLGGGDELAVGGTTISDDGGIVNSNMLVAFYPQGAPEVIAEATGGAINITSYHTEVSTDAGGDAFTLADGTVTGQVKLITLGTDGGGDAVITPANFTDTTITLDDAGDYVILMWDNVQWFVLANVGGVIA